MYDPKYAHYIAVTAIIIKDGKFLIVKRAPSEKIFPNLWTLPGGKLEVRDYAGRKKDTSAHWYNVLEDLLRREVKEETNLDIRNIRYLTSLVYMRPDGIPVMTASLFADYAGGEVRLEDSLTEYAWVNVREAKKYDLIEGIYQELEMFDQLMKGKSPGEWKA